MSFLDKSWYTMTLDDGQLSLYRYQGSADFLPGIFDDSVGIVPIAHTKMPCGLIEADSDPIRRWAGD